MDAFTYLALCLYVLALLMQLLDFITTLQALQLGAKEANPLVAWLMQKLGRFAGLLLVKLAAVAALEAGRHLFDAQTQATAFAVIVLVYLPVVGGNLGTINALRQRDRATGAKP